MAKTFKLRSGYVALATCLTVGTMLSGTSRGASPCPSAPDRGKITANPNRPTISDPADITQMGVLEVEYGYTRGWLGRGVHEDDVGGLFKFAALCDLEIRFSPDTYFQTNAGGLEEGGRGDNWIGAQFRFRRQSAHLPTLAFRYETKIPTASVSRGLGSGEPDHSLTLLMSKDVGKYHYDFNSGYFLSGVRTGDFDRNFNLALAFSHGLRGRLGITGEGYGETALNSSAPAYAAALLAATYQVTPRLVIDSGMDVGLTSGAPQKHFFAGFTYSILDVYGMMRPRRSIAAK